MTWLIAWSWLLCHSYLSKTSHLRLNTHIDIFEVWFLAHEIELLLSFIFNCIFTHCFVYLRRLLELLGNSKLLHDDLNLLIFIGSCEVLCIVLVQEGELSHSTLVLYTIVIHSLITSILGRILLPVRHIDIKICRPSSEESSCCPSLNRSDLLKLVNPWERFTNLTYSLAFFTLPLNHVKLLFRHLLDGEGEGVIDAAILDSKEDWNTF